MERTEARGYVVAIAVTTFAAAWAAVAGQVPGGADQSTAATATGATGATPMVRAIERREAAVRTRAVRVNKVLAARRRAHARRLRARLAEISRIRSIPAWSSAPSSGGTVSIALPVSSPAATSAPSTSTRSS